MRMDAKIVRRQAPGGVAAAPFKGRIIMRILIAVLLLLTTGMAFGQVYKWVDTNGETHYSDRPPTGNFQSESELRSSGVVEPPAPATATATANSTGAAAKTGHAAAKPKTPAEQEAEFRKRQIEKEEADKKNQKKEAEAAQRHRNCEAARSYLKGLETGQRVAHVDPNTGERSYLDDKQRAAETERAKKQVDSWCKDEQE
jgi:hypothetical protein